MAKEILQSNVWYFDRDVSLYYFNEVGGFMIAKVLSVRQPWAHLIVTGIKDIENRSWHTKLRGKILIHASQSIDMQAYDHLKVFYKLPPVKYLERGGIVGGVEIVDCVKEHRSEWFEGPYGFVLQNAQKFQFAKCKGQLNFFNVNLDEVYTLENMK